MKTKNRLIGGLCVVLASVACARAQDWPQWRGVGRDAKAPSFVAPKEWPKELTKKWNVTVGTGDATPALVGDKLYVSARQGGQEVVLCLDAGTGKEDWKDGYDALPPNGPAGRHPGPRSSPAVSDGKVVTYGARGTLSCLDAASGKVLWRKQDAGGGWPRFFTASSPLITDGLCVLQVGGEEKGGIVAYDLATGADKWKWMEDGTAYASPTLLKIDGQTQVVAITSKRVVGLGVSDGKLLWEIPFAPGQRMAYNAATPIVDGQTVIYAGSGRGTHAAKIEKQGDGFAAKELWANPGNSVQFDTPVLKNGLIFGLAQNGELFCQSAADGKTLWTQPGVGGRDFGSVVDAGPVLMALNAKGDLTVFEPSDKEFKKLASYKVAETDTYAYPVPSKNRIYVKDQEGLTLWTVAAP
jgi:outer membrane protein assembly factor BamB